MNKMLIKKGDTVKVLAGKEKGKTGKVLEVFPKQSRLSVEGMNIHVRFSRPKRQGEKGQRLELPAPMNVSKVMLICPHCGQATRSGQKCRHCGKDIR
jgi:large subunit ribosomal protein L24